MALPVDDGGAPLTVTFTAEAGFNSSWSLSFFDAAGAETSLASGDPGSPVSSEIARPASGFPGSEVVFGVDFGRPTPIHPGTSMGSIKVEQSDTTLRVIPLTWPADEPADIFISLNGRLRFA